MLTRRSILSVIISGFILCGCTASTDTTTTVYSTMEETTITLNEIWTPTENDIKIAEWFIDYISDSEEFSDLNDYRYYSRALGKEIDYLLSYEMWEVYYSDSINLNREIENSDIYLIRLNPYKLLEIYAENNSCSVDEICNKLSASREQLYYNWGYNPASVNYFSNHKKNEVTYSAEEQAIFGAYNKENRDVVMKTHMLIIDHNEDEVLYQSEVYESLQILRRDTLGAYTDGYYWTDYTDVEKSAAFKINGIGIRTVIPISLPNALSNGEQEDESITLMVNSSPYSYGCTDNDKLELAAIVSYIND